MPKKRAYIKYKAEHVFFRNEQKCFHNQRFCKQLPASIIRKMYADIMGHHEELPTSGSIYILAEAAAMKELLQAEVGWKSKANYYKICVICGAACTFDCYRGFTGLRWPPEKELILGERWR